ncbi:MAG: IS3 family transposase [Gemmatimonadales bacterium]
MTTRQRRDAVTHLRTAYPVSDRRACRLVQLARSRWQYHPRRADDGPLAAALEAKAAERPRWGYRRLALLLAREGWTVIHKRVLRVYREAGLRIRKRHRRKQVSTALVPRPVAAAANVQWTLDFITDAFTTGRKFRVLSIADEFTRECLALRADVAQPSTKGRRRRGRDRGPPRRAPAADHRQRTRVRGEDGMPGPMLGAWNSASRGRPSPWTNVSSRASTTSFATSD